MRRKYKKTMLDKISRDIIIISSLFVLFVIIGSLINKIFPQYTNLLIEKINYTNSYYNSDINVKEVISSNFKMDLIILLCMVICTLSIVLAPITFIILALKGLSIGYTINTLILSMKYSSLKMIFLTFIKFSIILPGMIVLTLISFKYFKEFLKNIKKNNKINCTYLIKRYIINSFLIIIFSLSGQTILNAIYTVTLKLF